MPQPIDLPNFFPRLISLFRSRAGNVMLPHVLDDVRLTHETDYLLQEGYASGEVTLDLNVVNTTLVGILTAESNRRYKITRMHRQATTGNTTWAVRRAGTNLHLGPYFEATRSDITMAECWLDPGDSIGLMGSNNAADTAIRTHVSGVRYPA